MEIIKWRDSFNLGITKIDSQHKKLLNIINDLYKVMLWNKPKEYLLKIIDELINYTKYHFKDEEKMLHKHNYEDLDEHIKTHEAFITKIEEFKTNVEYEKKGVKLEMIAFLRDWLVDHIQGSDREYVESLNKNNLTNL